MAYYLMIKEAKILGLKYLCKCGDYKDPTKYKGSGTYWKRILKKYNPEITTIILGKYKTKQELRTAGEYYSEYFNIVKDKSWANLIPEIGDGGYTTLKTIRAYDPLTKKIRHFKSEIDIPKSWIRGSPKWKKSKEGVEKTRLAHIGSKRSEETKNKMKNSIRRKRMTVMCPTCQSEITPQNIKRHMKIHDV